MSKLKDLTGRMFGFLYVQRRMPNYVQENGRTRTRWLTTCLLCGKAYVADGSHLLHGNVISCGCFKNMKSALRGQEYKGVQRPIRDLTGMKFGYLRVIERCENFGPKTAWLCLCENCGSYTKVRSNHLLRGLVSSDGCIKSVREEQMAKWFNEHKIPFEREYTFPDLLGEGGGNLRFDFGLIDMNKNLICLVECQGEQHGLDKTGDFGRQQREQTDKQKIDYCLINHLAFQSVWYDKDFEEQMQEIEKFYRKSTAVPSRETGRCIDYPGRE